MITDSVYRFCECCDKCVINDNFVEIRNMCVDCAANDESRLSLPHYKARPIIETHYIPDIAQLIFDYYYTPRRYFKGDE